MPDYTMHKVNPEDYQMLTAKMKRSYLVITQEEWLRYFRNNGIYTQDQVIAMQAQIESRIANQESSLFQKLMGLAWYQFILPRSKDLLTPKNLLKILSKLDHLLPYMPSDFWRSVLKALDKAAEFAYTKLD
jgi:hypothetical protein